MKKIFIDGGARVGESIEIYVKNNPDLIGCEIHLFECNPNHLDELNKLQITYPEYNIFVYPMALWDEEGEQDFYFSEDVWGDLSCTLYQNSNQKLNRDNPVKVKSIKLSNFLNQFNQDDYIIIKLDIEGAEYEVVKDLLDTNKILDVNEIYVEWHDHFCSGVDFETLRNQLKDNTNIKYDTWNY